MLDLCIGFGMSQSDSLVFCFEIVVEVKHLLIANSICFLSLDQDELK